MMMTRAFLPDHVISYEIAKKLLIDYYIPRHDLDPSTIEAQQRVSDYIVLYTNNPEECAPSPKVLYLSQNKGTAHSLLQTGHKAFDSVEKLCSYLNNS